MKVRDPFPKEAEKWHTIPDVDVKLDVLVQTFDLPETSGVLLASRLLPKGDPFRAVLQSALEQKLPKLSATSAGSYILLFQGGGTGIGTQFAFFNSFSVMQAVVSAQGRQRSALLHSRRAPCVAT